MVVSIPQKPEHLTQINLYVPYPEYGKDQNEETVLQFHYKVNSKGDIEIFNTHDRKMCGYGGTLKNVNIRFEGEYLHFMAGRNNELNI